MDDLPHEVLMLVMSFLDGETLSLVSGVNKFFRKVHNHEYLWNDLFRKSFRNQHISPVLEIEPNTKYRYIKKRMMENAYRRQKFVRSEFPATRQIFSFETFSETAYTTEFFVCSGEVVHLYSYKTGGEKVVMKTLRENAEGVERKLIFDCAYFPVNQRLVCAGSSEYVEIWNPIDNEMIVKVDTVRKGVWACDGFRNDHVCISTSDGKVKIVDINEGKVWMEFSPERDPNEISRVAMFDCTSTGDGHTIISSSDHLYLWDVRMTSGVTTNKNDEKINSISKPVHDIKLKSRIYEICCTPQNDQNVVTCGTLDGSVIMFDLRKFDAKNRLFDVSFSNEAIKGLQYDYDKLVVGSNLGWTVCKEKDDKTLQYHNSTLRFGENENQINFIPVSGKIFPPQVNMGCLFFNDQHFLVGKNENNGICEVYDPLYDLRKVDSSKCSVM